MRLPSVLVAALVAIVAPMAAGRAAAQTVPGFDPAALDRSIAPCDDLYQFACGGWLKDNPVPPDRARYGRRGRHREEGRGRPAAAPRPDRGHPDPHAPGRYRVNGVVVNMPEFQQAFSCAAGTPMVLENACRVW